MKPSFEERIRPYVAPIMVAAVLWGAAQLGGVGNLATRVEALESERGPLSTKLESIQESQGNTEQYLRFLSAWVCNNDQTNWENCPVFVTP